MTEIEKVELLGHHAVRCPHCNKEIYIPEYRQTPITQAELRKATRIFLDRMKREEANAK